VAERIAFRMNLNPGQAEAYRKRHDDIFPDLVAALKDAGISDYTIWLDPESNALFGTLVRADGHRMDDLPRLDVMKRWWAHMADVMQTHPDNVPVQVQLIPMFELK
jgi:L-rhamnose mutarotase